MCGEPIRPAIEAVLMMLPLFCFSITGSTCFMPRKTPTTLTSSTPAKALQRIFRERLEVALDDGDLAVQTNSIGHVRGFLWLLRLSRILLISALGSANARWGRLFHLWRGLTRARFLKQNRTLDCCVDAFSSHEPVPTSLENAFGWRAGPETALSPPH